MKNNPSTNPESEEDQQLKDDITALLGGTDEADSLATADGDSTVNDALDSLINTRQSPLFDSYSIFNRVRYLHGRGLLPAK